MDAAMRYEEPGTCNNWPRCRHPRTGRTHSKIKVIKERIRKKSKRSMRKMTKSLEIDEKSVRTIVKEDLKLSYLKMTSRQQLPALQKQKGWKDRRLS